MEILLAIDDLDDLIHSSPVVPLSDQVRIDRQALRAAADRLRPAATDLFGLMPPRTGPIADVFAAIDEVEALVGAARPIPLTTQVRIDLERVYDQLDRLRAACPAAIMEQQGPAEPPPPTRWSDTLAALDALAELVHEAEPVRSARWLRVDAAALRDASQRLRAEAAKAIEPADGDGIADLRAAIDELDGHVAAAKPMRRSSDVRVPSGRLYEVLERAYVALGRATDAS
jgi:hypothetical protein